MEDIQLISFHREYCKLDRVQWFQGSRKVHRSTSCAWCTRGSSGGLGNGAMFQGEVAESSEQVLGQGHRTVRSASCNDDVGTASRSFVWFNFTKPCEATQTIKLLISNQTLLNERDRLNILQKINFLFTSKQKCSTNLN